MDVESLKPFFENHVIPTIKRQPKTFLSIAKQPHYENVISNIYAFFFTVEEVHGVQDLFMASLLDIINQSERDLQKKVHQITDFTVDTEVSTNKNGRIDLLLSSENHAIIIENKIYHTLGNDLEDYWQSTPVIPNDESNKIGIVLSLNKLHPNHDHFINITHLELLQRVMLNLGKYILTANDKYVIYLKDFYQNITNLSKSEMNSKDLKFYLDYQKNILEAVELQDAVRRHIIDHVENVARLTNEGFIISKSRGVLNERLRFLVSPNNKNLMITIVFEKLLTKDRELILIVEMKYDLLKSKELYRSITFSEQEKARLKDDFYTDLKNDWCHFAYKDYKITEENFVNLSKFIVEKLERDHLLTIYKKLDAIIPKSNE